MNTNQPERPPRERIHSAEAGCSGVMSDMGEEWTYCPLCGGRLPWVPVGPNPDLALLQPERPQRRTILDAPVEGSISREEARAAVLAVQKSRQPAPLGVPEEMVAKVANSARHFLAFYDEFGTDFPDGWYANLGLLLDATHQLAPQQREPDGWALEVEVGVFREGSGVCRFFAMQGDPDDFAPTVPIWIGDARLPARRGVPERERRSMIVDYISTGMFENEAHPAHLSANGADRMAEALLAEHEASLLERAPREEDWTPTHRERELLDTITKLRLDIEKLERAPQPEPELDPVRLARWAAASRIEIALQGFIPSSVRYAAVKAVLDALYEESRVEPRCKYGFKLNGCELGHPGCTCADEVVLEDIGERAPRGEAEAKVQFTENGVAFVNPSELLTSAKVQQQIEACAAIPTSGGDALERALRETREVAQRLENRSPIEWAVGALTPMTIFRALKDGAKALRHQAYIAEVDGPAKNVEAARQTAATLDHIANRFAERNRALAALPVEQRPNQEKDA